MNKLVYSIWTEPSGGDILKHATNWHTAEAQLYCLAISVLEGQRYFDEIEMVTDSRGAKILEKLNLPMEIKTSLDMIDLSHGGFWALGKIYAYKQQTKPFLHLDTDAILFKGLPHWAKDADIFVQNTEDKDWFARVYQPEVDFLNKLGKAGHFGYYPKNWDKLKSASCMGLFGSNNIDFVQGYCEEVERFLFSKENEVGWSKITNKGAYCIIFEQYLLDIHAKNAGVEITYFDRDLDRHKLSDLGFTHIWGAKKAKDLTQRLRAKLGRINADKLAEIDSVIKKMK